MLTGFPASKATPISSGASTETVRLYRRLHDMGRKVSFLLGTSDHFAAMPNTAPSPTFFGSEESLIANTGRRASVICFEYHDSNWTSRYGSTGTTVMRNKIIAANALGQVVVLHNHMGNPVTGQLSREGQTYPYPGGNYDGTGYVYDTTGSPLNAIKTGGAQIAAWTAYLDRLATFIESLVDASGKKIPVILRWFHEANGGWFWWGTSAADYKIVWQQFVAYLKDTKALTNVLFNVNFTTESSFSGWYPGDTYVDIISLDNYDNTSTPTVGNGGKLATAYTAMLALSTAKPFALGEFGYENHGNNTSIWTQGVSAFTSTYRKFGMAVMWRTPWGPDTSDSTASKANQSAMASDPRVLTLAP